MLCPCPDEMLPGPLTPGAAAKQPRAGPTCASWLRGMSNPACLPATLYCACLGGFCVRVVGQPTKPTEGELCVFSAWAIVGLLPQAEGAAGAVAKQVLAQRRQQSVTSCCLVGNQPNDCDHNRTAANTPYTHVQPSQVSKLVYVPLVELGRLLHRQYGAMGHLSRCSQSWCCGSAHPARLRPVVLPYSTAFTPIHSALSHTPCS